MHPMNLTRALTNGYAHYLSHHPRVLALNIPTVISVAAPYTRREATPISQRSFESCWAIATPLANAHDTARPPPVWLVYTFVPTRALTTTFSSALCSGTRCEAPPPLAHAFDRYVLYGDGTLDDVMNNLGKTTLLWLTRVFVGVAVLCHYPINQHVARAALDDVVRAFRGEEFTEYMPYWRLCLNTILVFIIAVSLSLTVSAGESGMLKPSVGFTVTVGRRATHSNTALY